MKRLWLLLLCSCLLSPVVWAQEEPRPAPMLKVDHTFLPMKLSSMKTEVRVQGVLAETSMTMTFFNPNGRRMDGELYFPMPEGATVSGYALDVNGRMVDGVVVKKDKARQVFETEVRKGVDPGLVEWTKGNTFKTRVYPIPAKGTRTIRVDYVTELLPDGAAYTYHLPLNFQKPVELFRLRVEVAKAGQAPEVTSGDLSNFSFASWREGFVAETELKNAVLNKDLRISLPDAGEQRVLGEVGEDGETYVCLNVPVKEIVQRAAPLAPKRVRILWDRSQSHGRADHGKALGVLRDFCKTLRAAEVRVELVPFADVCGRGQEFVLRNGDGTALVAAIKALQYDGGTQFGCLSAMAADTTVDFTLLFSDGLSTFGREDPGTFKKPVYLINSTTSANHAFLRYLAMKSGGAYFNLSRRDPKEVVARLGRSAYSFLGAEFSGQELEEVYPRVPQPVQGRFVLVGKALKGKGKVTLKFGFPGEVRTREVIDFDVAKAPEGAVLRRLWAQKKLDELLIFPTRNEEEIVALGKRFSIVTPGTSLIVLERVEQYLEHEIVPPKSMPEWRKHYFDVLENKRQEFEAKRSHKLEKVVAMWRERTQWYETEFSYPEDFKVGGKHDKSLSIGDQTLGNAPPAPMQESLRSAPTSADLSDSVRQEADFEQAPGGAMPTSPARAAPMETKAKKRNGGGDTDDETRIVEPGVAMKPWDPQTPYLKALKKADPARHYELYLEQRKEYGNAPAYYLDCSDFFMDNERPDLGLQVLSNLAELELENPALLRILAHRLAQLEKLELSSLVFEEVLKMRPEEPQSYRDLALVLGRMGKYERAVELLYEVVLKEWDDRFPQIEVIALTELNNLLAKAQAAGQTGFKVDERLIKNLELDVRIVMTWDADMTDMDLWVLEPSGEKAYYSHPRTRIGGLVSRDFTRGYGPETYSLKKAMRGMYEVQTKFYGSQSQNLSGAVTLQVDIFSHYGRPNEKRRSITLRLTDRKEVFTVGEIEF